MDRLLAVTANKKYLAWIVAGMVSMLGGLAVDTVTRHVRLSVLATLRPAESAVRRLIAVLAHGMTVPERVTRAAPVGAIPKGDGGRVPAFPLFDSRLDVDPKETRVAGFGPNVDGFDGRARPPAQGAEPGDDDPVDAAGVVRRVRMLMMALEDMPRHAARLARTMARKTLPIRAMRPGRPPGHRAPGAGGRWRHPVDEVLADCHALALLVLNEPVPP